ncbi:hypothetical protein BBK82_29190 [Lentzea guizhouensis]|uniref:Uncharacterized protein n=1 Tax=Lentzea guizhouensis TaxID=1586287 RepID=A0A1B2HP71_9PSEU|nr:DUF6461 domain-containing protein [Lentzea guizhouensis]ANZ39518.1 hypothetical protein BBK82_29190 [Lentzea guizhouensis]
MGDELRRLHFAAGFGTAREVAGLLDQVDDVDAVFDDRTALWQAVNGRNFDTVELLLAAGADPARQMMSGWSPARLSLTTEHPLPTDEVLTAEERAAVAERDRLVAALGRNPDVDGFSIACVGGIDADEAVRRLDASAVPADELPDDLDDWWEEPFGDDNELAVGITDVPGGCVVMQPWYFNASTPVVAGKLSVGTVVYSMYANPKSGNQGRIDRDGAVVDWDLHPGGPPNAANSTADVLLIHLYARQAVACCCAYAGLRPTDSKAFTEPDRWLLLPDRDYWHA